MSPITPLHPLRVALDRLEQRLALLRRSGWTARVEQQAGAACGWRSAACAARGRWSTEVGPQLLEVRAVGHGVVASAELASHQPLPEARQHEARSGVADAADAHQPERRELVEGRSPCRPTASRRSPQALTTSLAERRPADAASRSGRPSRVVRRQHCGSMTASSTGIASSSAARTRWLEDAWRRATTGSGEPRAGVRMPVSGRSRTSTRPHEHLREDAELVDAARRRSTCTARRRRSRRSRTAGRRGRSAADRSAHLAA